MKEQTPVTGMEKMAEDTALGRMPGVDGVQLRRGKWMERNVGVGFLTREGPVVREIVDTATERGSRKQSSSGADPRGISGFMLGNVAEAVVKQSPSTVLVIKPRRQRSRPPLQGQRVPGGRCGH